MGQTSFKQLQNEKESLIEENKSTTQSLKQKHQDEIRTLSEQNQRLQTQVNNAQNAFSDFKENSGTEINALTEQITSLETKLLELEKPTEKFRELEATKICLESEVEDIRNKHKIETEARVRAEMNASKMGEELTLTKSELETCQSRLKEAVCEFTNVKKMSEKRKTMLD